ncbi:hypothetical protein Tco_0320443 [Tanacetum coccineum]
MLYSGFRPLSQDSPTAARPSGVRPCLSVPSVADPPKKYQHKHHWLVYDSIIREAVKVKQTLFKQWWLGMASVRQLLAEGEEREEALPTVEGQAKALAEG